MIRVTTCQRIMGQSLGYFLSIASRANRVLAASSFGVSCSNSVPSHYKTPYGYCPRANERRSNFSGWWLKFKSSKEKPHCGKHNRYPQPMEFSFASNSSMQLRANIARSFRLSRIRSGTSACFPSDFKRLNPKTSLRLRSERKRVKGYLQQVGSKEP